MSRKDETIFDDMIDSVLNDTSPQENQPLKKKSKIGSAGQSYMGDRPLSSPLMRKDEKHKEEIDALRKGFEVEKKAIQQSLNETSLNAKNSREMPVTNQKILLIEKWIDTNLIDISPYNKRSPLFLDRHTLQDILPSIEKNKQITPGLLRPKDDGRYELIYGSRRLKCAILLQRKYFALIGDIPDADVERLSDIENESMEVGHYEKAIYYADLIKKRTLRSWDQVAENESCSVAHAYRLREVASLNIDYVYIFPVPSKASFRHLKYLIKECECNPEAASIALEEILLLKKLGDYSYSSLTVNEQAITLFKKLMKDKGNTISSSSHNEEPKSKRGKMLVAVNSKNENIARMKTTKLGNRTIFIERIAESDIDEIWEFIKEKASTASL